MIAGYRGGQLLAPFTVEGACNRTVFEIWLATCLIPLLKPGEWSLGNTSVVVKGGMIQITTYPGWSVGNKHVFKHHSITRTVHSKSCTQWRSQ
jgi:hypothetical protein